MGFDYFKKQIGQDEDFACLQDETYYLDKNFSLENGADKVYIIDRKDDGNALIPCLPSPKTKFRPIDERHVRKQITKRRKKNRNPKTHRR